MAGNKRESEGYKREVQRQRQRRLLYLGLGSILLYFSFLVIAAGLQFDSGMDLKFFDMFMNLSPDEPMNPAIQVLMIDDESSRQAKINYGETSEVWSNSFFYMLLRELVEAEPKVVAIDRALREIESPTNEYIARLMSGSVPFVLASEFTNPKVKRQLGQGTGIETSARHLLLPDPVLTGATNAHIGYVDFRQDSDGLVRRFSPYVDWQGDSLPHFDLQALTASKIVAPESIDYAPFDYLSLSGARIRLHPRHGTVYINYKGYQVEEHSIINLLDAELQQGLKEKLKGKLVFIGDYRKTAQDYHLTPASKREGGFRSLPGVVIHAHALHTLLLGEAPWILQRKWVALIALLCGLVMVISTRAASILKSVAAFIVLAALYVAGITLLYYTQQLYVGLVDPLLCMAYPFVVMTYYKYHCNEGDRRMARDLFRRHLSKEALDELDYRELDISLSSERREISVLFSDIRGFTTISEENDPNLLVEQLNEHFEAICEPIFKHGGMIDKFVGDQVVALFGVPITGEPDPEHAIKACRAGIDLMNVNLKMQEKWKREGKPVFDIGVGITTGEVIVGFMGLPNRPEFDVIGDTVNLGARLEGLNKGYGTHIIISEYTQKKLDGTIKARDMGMAEIRGKSDQVRIYVLDDNLSLGSGGC
jgi:adenylate cyclase